MFEIGFSELVLVFVIALLVLGPEKLPDVVRWVVIFIKKARAITNSVIHEFNTNDIKKEISSDYKSNNSTTRNEKHE